MHPHAAHDREGHCPHMCVAEANGRPLTLAMPVPQPKRGSADILLLEPGKSDTTTFTVAAPRVRPRSQRPPAVDGGFLEHLLAHLVTPDQPGHHQFGDTTGIDREHSPGGFRQLPRVERVDEIEPSPRHVHIGVITVLCDCGFRHSQALVEREPGCSSVTPKHLLLFDSRVETELKRGVSGHRARSLTYASDKAANPTEVPPRLELLQRLHHR